MRWDLKQFEFIYNAAVGGTNTDIANVMLEFQLYLDDVGPKGADVIINGYSTNEMHVLSMQQAQGEDKTLESQVFGLMQRFIHSYVELRWECGQMIKIMKPVMFQENLSSGQQ